jgi:hypothetical protein
MKLKKINGLSGRIVGQALPDASPATRTSVSLIDSNDQDDRFTGKSGN